MAKPARIQGGVATADVIVSARVGDNAELFAQILALHVPRGSLVADVTFGLGAFWKKVPAGAYRVLASDIALKPEVRAPEGFSLQTGVDCRALPHADASLDAGLDTVARATLTANTARRSAPPLRGLKAQSSSRHRQSPDAPADPVPRSTPRIRRFPVPHTWCIPGPTPATPRVPAATFPLARADAKWAGWCPGSPVRAGLVLV